VSHSGPETALPSRDLARVRWLAQVLDARFRLPGTSIRFGFDAIIGILPGVGDTITLVIGAYIIWVALRRRVRSSIIARMLGNLVIDWLVGLVPLIDLVLDVAFKAHLRNARLLERELVRRGADVVPEDAR
jgi:hypothetical protein